MTLYARDVMTGPPITVRQDASLAEALELMITRRISGLPVVDEYGQLIGILTEGDLLHRAEVGTADRPRPAWWNFLRGAGLNAEEYVHSHSRVVKDLMTVGVATVAEATPLEDIVKIMEQRRVKRLPVVDGGKVVGIVSRGDLLRAVASAMGAGESGGDDATILARLNAELERQKWFSSRNISISVQNGVVALAGVVTDEWVRKALLVAARNASGKQEIEDELAIIEPTSGMVYPAV
jgi:CBS domain-containing protein